MHKMLEYDSRDMRYHGVRSDGTPVQVDGDAIAEERTNIRIKFDYGYLRADEEARDPDNWDETMHGWIPEGE